MSPDGSKLIGLGTDVGSMALCYRRDLFKKAGLPSDRDAVTKLWPTWDDFITTGKKFTGQGRRRHEVHRRRLDTYNTILMQEAGKGANQTYFDQGNKFVMESNPAVKAAWDETVKMSQAGSRTGTSSCPTSGAGAQEGHVRHRACPAWMLGLIKGSAAAGRAASGTSPGSPAAAAAGAGPGSRCPRRASTPRRRPTW